MRLKTQISFLLLAVALVFSGCKTSKTIAANGQLNSKLSAKQLIKSVSKTDIDFSTLVGRLKLGYVEKEKSKSTTVSFRMEKDKTIWMSYIGIAKVLITQNRVAFYNKWDNTYFDGDFAYLSNLLGTDLDFNKVQNLLLGQALFNLNDDTYDISTNDKSYILQPKNQRDLFEVFMLVNPSHYKMDSQQIAQPKERRILQIDYLTYQEVDNQTLPSQTKILAIEDEEQLEINLELKSVALNESVRFPFKIPSGYDRIEL